MKDNPVILAVDRNQRNLELLAQFLGKEGYQTLTATSLPSLDQALARSREEIGLVLVDISGFDRSIWDRCQALRDLGIPFLVISPRQSATIHQESLDRGAASVLVKPLMVRELLGIIRGLLKKAG